MDPSFHRALSEGFLQTQDDDQLTEPACKSDTPVHNPSYLPSCQLSPNHDKTTSEHFDQASITFVNYMKADVIGETNISADKELCIIFLPKRHVKDNATKLHLSLSFFTCYGDSDRGLVSHLEQGKSRKRLSDDVHVFIFTDDHRHYVIIDLKESNRQITEITISNAITYTSVNIAHVYLRRDWLLPNDTLQKFLVPLARVVSELNPLIPLGIYSASIRPLAQIPAHEEVKCQYADMGLYLDKNSAQNDLAYTIKINSQSSQRFPNENDKYAQGPEMNLKQFDKSYKDQGDQGVLRPEVDLAEAETQTIEEIKQHIDKEVQVTPLTQDNFSEPIHDEEKKLFVDIEVQTEGEFLVEKVIREFNHENMEKQIEIPEEKNQNSFDQVQDFSCQVGEVESNFQEEEKVTVDIDTQTEDILGEIKESDSKETQTVGVESQNKEKEVQVSWLSKEAETQTIEIRMKNCDTEIQEIAKDYLSQVYFKAEIKHILNSISVAVTLNNSQNQDGAKINNYQVEENKQTGNNVNLDESKSESLTAEIRTPEQEDQKTLIVEHEEKAEQKQVTINECLTSPHNNLLSTDDSEIGTKVTDSKENGISRTPVRFVSRKMVPKCKTELFGILRSLTFSLKIGKSSGLPNIKGHDSATAIIQCFMNTPLLWPYFYRGSHLGDINPSSERKLASIFGELVKKTKSRMGSREELLVLTQKLLSSINEAAFKTGMNIHDNPATIASVIIQGLNNDLRREEQETVCRKLNFALQSGSPLKFKADKSFEDMLSKSNSIITDLFCGQLLKTIKCPKCKYQSTASELFCNLTLTIQDNNNGQWSLEDLLQQFTQETNTGPVIKDNTSCMEHRFRMKTLLWRLPEVLMINLEPSQQNINLQYHLNKTLNLTTFVNDSKDESVKDAKYTLFGVVNYDHKQQKYHANCLNLSDKKWYCYNEEEVKESRQQRNCEDESPKVLFYIRSSHLSRNDNRSDFIDRVIWHS